MIDTKSFFEKKILPIIKYVGAIGATIMSIAYIIAVFVLINGFKAQALLQTTIFSFVNAGVGLIIMQFLKVQGISFAEHLPENEKIIKIYYNSKTKDKKAHSIKYFWITSLIRDVFIKGLSLAATTIGLVYIVIKGSNDWNLLLLALVNLLLFICFGLLALVRAYNFYNNQQIPFIKEKLKENNIKFEEETKC